MLIEISVESDGKIRTKNLIVKPLEETPMEFKEKFTRYFSTALLKRIVRELEIKAEDRWIDCKSRRGHLGERRSFRFLDFKRIKFPESYAFVLQSTQDRFRTARIGLICFRQGMFSCILLPSKITTLML